MSAQVTGRQIIFHVLQPAADLFYELLTKLFTLAICMVTAMK